MTSELLIKNKVAKYLLLNQDIAALEAQKKLVKAELEPYLREAPLNSRGSYVIDFGDSLDVAGTRYKGLQKVRKESKVLNEERALAFLRQDQAFECAIDVVEHVNQDALWDLFVNDMISQEELDSFFDVSESFAFMPTKE